MTRIQELICTKINHDIIGNIGAVCNAVELLEDGDMDFIDDITNILKTSSFVLSSRCKFFRIVFGADNAAIDNLQETVENYVKTISSKNYPITAMLKNVQREDVKTLLLIVMIASELMVKGGEIVVDNNIVKVFSQQTNKEKFNNLLNLSLVEMSPSNAANIYLLEVLTQREKTLHIIETDENNFLIEVK